MAPSTSALLTTSARRWVCCLLAVLLPAQAALLMMQRAQGASHAHTAPAQAAMAPPANAWAATTAAVTVDRVIAALREGHGSARTAAPWFKAHGLQLAHAGHASHPHTHEAGERHHHTPGDLTVVLVDPVQDAGGSSMIQAASGVWAPPSQTAVLALAIRPGAPVAKAPAPWTSRQSALPDKPPKMA